MNWLLHNVVADLYGPYFLLFYAMTIVALVVACYTSIRRIDGTKDLEPPRVPAKLDPYEIAYLRGGDNEVTRVAIASLIQRGLLRITDKKRWVSAARKIDRGRKPAPRELSPIEANVMKWDGFPAEPRQLFSTGGVPSLLRESCSHYQDELAAKNLLAPPEMSQLANRLWAIGSVLILGLGLYKLVVALSKGHHNVAFLLIVAIAGMFALAAACKAFPRTTHVGRAYLEQLKLAYGGLKSQVHPIGSLTSALTMAGDPGSRTRLRDPSAYSDCLLMVGIFGMASLADTPLSDLTAMFRQGAAKSGGCGAGGCGGGGCGGGGCGGGGCGGCGG
jgi:uncharacterized protein (TIGR04222 family)